MSIHAFVELQTETAAVVICFSGHTEHELVNGKGSTSASLCTVAYKVIYQVC